MKLTKDKRFFPLFWFLSLTWGFLCTFPGLIFAAVLLLCGHKPQRLGPLVYFRVGKNWGGCEMGVFFLRDTTSSEHVTYHEAGHSIQNLMFGPLMPFIVSIPSFTRYHYRNFVRNFFPEKFKKMPPYDAIWFEGMATRLGKRYFMPNQSQQSEQNQ